MLDEALFIGERKKAMDTSIIVITGIGHAFTSIVVYFHMKKNPIMGGCERT